MSNGPPRGENTVFGVREQVTTQLSLLSHGRIQKGGGGGRVPESPENH